MNNKRLIVGLIGPKGSGKDYAARVILNNFKNWKRVAFADPIKKTIAELFGCSLKDVESLKSRSTIALCEWNEDECHLTPIFYGSSTGRDIVRGIGMLMRNYDDQQFNQYVENEINGHPNINYVITDVRFDNEALLIERLGGILIEITRDGVEYDHHITESGKLKGDIIIHNTDDSNFDKAIKEVVNNLIGYKE